MTINVVPRLSPSGAVFGSADFITQFGGRSFPSGALLFENSRLAYWSVKRGAQSVAVDNREVANVVGGQAFRLPIGHPAWLSQSAFVIDPVLGSDTNVGSAASPIASHRELELRFGLFPMGKVAQTVTINSSLSETIRIRGAGATTGMNLTYSGVVTQLASGVITTYTAAVPATNQGFELTDATANFTGLLNKQLRITSGAQVGATAHIVKVISATQVRITPFQIFTGASPSPAIVNPANGSAYVVEGLPSVISADVEQYQRPLFLDRIQFLDTAGAGQSQFAGSYQTINLTRCWLPIAPRFTKAVRIGGTMFPQATVFAFGTPFDISGCGFQGACSLNGDLKILRGCTFQGGLQVLEAVGGASIEVSQVLVSSDGFSCWDSSASGLRLVNARLVKPSTAPIYGSGNAGVGILIERGSLLGFTDANLPTSAPTLTGTGGDLQLISTVIPYANLPAVGLSDAQGLCGILRIK